MISLIFKKVKFFTEIIDIFQKMLVNLLLILEILAVLLYNLSIEN